MNVIHEKYPGTYIWIDQLENPLQQLSEALISDCHWLFVNPGEYNLKASPFFFVPCENDNEIQIIDLVNHRKILDEYVFYPYLDVVGYDIGREKEYPLAKNAYQFNTNGWIKNQGKCVKETIRESSFTQDLQGLYRKKPSGTKKIPKIIHQIWIGPKPVPKCVSTWKPNHPDWDYHLWTNDDIEKFEWKNKKQFDEIQTWCGKADIWRYEILAKYGGIFLDADSKFRKILDEELLVNECFFAYENEALRDTLIANGAIGAIPQHPVMLKCIEKISKLTESDLLSIPAWICVGPKFVTEIVANEKEVFIYPSYYFFPTHYSGRSYPKILHEKAYCEQLWGSTLNNYDETEK